MTLPAFAHAARILHPNPDAHIYQHDPVAWAHDMINWPAGIFLTDGQQQILTNLAEHGREAVRAPRGYGKSAPAAIGTHWWAATRNLQPGDWKAVTTAGTWIQLRVYLWGEIHKWAGMLNWDKLGRAPYNPYRELTALSLRLSNGEANAITSDKADRIEGAHADRLLAVVDEGKIVPEDSWDAIEGYFASPGEHAALALSIPGAPVGRFYDIHARKPGYEDWHTTHITIDQAIAERRIEPGWVEQRARQWGTDSALYLNHVLAEFGGEEDGVIPLSWVEAAQDRWKAIVPRLEDGTVDSVWYQQDLDRLGVDVADTGSNETVIARRAGNVIVALEADADDVDTAQVVLRICVARGGVPVVDGIGVGAGVVKELRRDRHTRGVVSFVASEGTKRKDSTGEFGFPNKRSAAWWNLREILDPRSGLEPALPPDDMLLGDLTAPRWREIAGGRIQVESKQDIAKRLRRSTDRGDAVVQAFWPEKGRSRMGGESGGWGDDRDLTRRNPFQGL